MQILFLLSRKKFAVTDSEITRRLKLSAGFILLCAGLLSPPAHSELPTSSKNNEKFFSHKERQQWLLLTDLKVSVFVPDRKTREVLLENVYDIATEFQLSPSLVMAIIHTESGFDPYALSHSGAMGLMQVMPFWKMQIGNEDDNLIDLRTNLRYGCTIFRYYLRKERHLEQETHRIQKALARYNGSYRQSRYPNKVLSLLKQYWQN